MKKSLAGMCFPDNPDDHMKVMRNLLDYYIEIDGDAGETVVGLEADGEYLTIEVSKGFHCLSISVEDIEKALAKESP